MSTVLKTRFSVTDAPALFTGASPALLHPDIVRIRDVVESFFADTSRAITTRPSVQILFSSHRFQMYGVDAGANPTQVIQVDVARNERDEVKVEGSVSQLSSSIDAAQLTVAAGVRRASPDPATAFNNVISGPVVDPRVAGGPRRSHATIMLGAHSAPKTTSGTFRIVNGAHRIHDYTLVHRRG